MNALDPVIDVLEKFLLSQGELSEKKIMTAYALFSLNRQSVLYNWVSTLGKEEILFVLTDSTPEIAILRAFLANEVYDRIDTQGLYTYLLDTDIWPSFVTFLIENDRIEKLFLASVEENRLHDAFKLFRVYAQTLSPGSSLSEDDLFTLFECFLKERSLNIDVKIFHGVF